MQKFSNIVIIIIFYLFITQNPLKYILPAKEPKLVYDSRYSWVKKEKQTFSDSYNQHFKENLFTPSNSFFAYLKVLFNNDFSEKTKQWLEKENIDSKIIISSKWSNPKEIISYYSQKENQVNLKHFVQNHFLTYKEDLEKIIPAIELPKQNIYYHEPLFANKKDQDIYENRILILLLGIYFDTNQNNINETITHFKLLSNTGNLVRIYHIASLYEALRKKFTIPTYDNHISWPNVREIILVRHKGIFFQQAYNKREYFHEFEDEIFAQNPDSFIDQNRLLKFLTETYQHLDTILPDTTIDEPTLLKLKGLLNLGKLDFLSHKKALLAERIFFQRSVENLHDEICLPIINRECLIISNVLMAIPHRLTPLTLPDKDKP